MGKMMILILAVAVGIAFEAIPIPVGPIHEVGHWVVGNAIGGDAKIVRYNLTSIKRSKRNNPFYRAAGYATEAFFYAFFMRKRKKSMFLFAAGLTASLMMLYRAFGSVDLSGHGDAMVVFLISYALAMLWGWRKIFPGKTKHPTREVVVENKRPYTKGNDRLVVFSHPASKTLD